MKQRPILLLAIALNLLVLVALAFAYPHLMVSPGPLVKGHAELATDCFACHAAWRGASSPRCIECHAVADVGLKTTRGVPIAAGTLQGSFHQALIEQDCMACHSDHQGPKLTKRSRKPFSHGLLKVAVRDTLFASCHAAPKDTVHRDLKHRMRQVPRQQGLEAGALRPQALLAPAELDRCESCHNAPDRPTASPDPGQLQVLPPDAAPGSRRPSTTTSHFVLNRDHQDVLRHLPQEQRLQPLHLLRLP